jgi:electron transfer flavoprotein alpha subunit
MARNILVLTEHAEGKLESITLQLLAAGRALAQELKVELIAAVIGHQLDPIVTALDGHGMDRIVAVNDPALASAGAEVQTRAIVEAVRQADARLVLIGYSLAGMELAPAVATQLGMAALTNCVNVEILEGVVTITRPLFDGTVHAEIALEEKEAAVIALQKGMVAPIERSSKHAEVQSLALDVRSFPSRSKVVAITEEPKGDIDISKANIVVAVGRGIGDQEKIHFIEDLAEALGGVLACSRPVVDVGWLPRERQVGASGRTVAPKVYIACGISGAIQHLSGMRESRQIIAINKDPNAPIFSVAHLGVIGDLFEIVPALAKVAKESRTA